MSLILNIETATGVCSVALARDGKLVERRESTVKNSHSSVLTLLMDDVFRTTGVPLGDLDAVAVSEGPGSYTGLRIGVASAKGLCYALDKPLIGISTLRAMALGMAHAVSTAPETQLLFCPMIDARRMEVYCAIFDEKGKEVREIRAEIVDENSFQEYLVKNRILFAGDGALKCRKILDNHPNAIFSEDFQTSAEFMIPLSEEKFIRNNFADLAYFEPYYLKDFVAGKPRVKGLK
ncbi:MAG: tRNA (adenosine(37)-N6)-threonylcarbamoyltransferase complex dimerization subunit type 1 TsaB [Bacteroidetes bacterium]|nr:tRNA (adenosine(37)-N6)-threonylcarbamoyltransferase complex dimerization subunit type 1 TsaB [Bacteroidota bacterium]